jgi:hypothetical protein
MERPTFVEVETLSSGETVLMVEMDTYAVPSTYRGLRLSPGEAEVLRKSQLRFLKEYVNKYVAAIDKFLEWESLASQRKEAFTRDISSVPAWGNIGNGTFKFKFHSGNDRSHFLVIAFSAAGTTLDEKAQYFDVRNAKELKRLLLAFESGSIQHTALDDIYK